MRMILQAGHMAQKTKAHNNCSPSHTRGNLPWSSSGLWHLPPSFFLSLFITSWFTDFYSFVLCSSLIPTSSLTCPSPLPTIQSGVPRLCMWYFYHVIALGYNFLLLSFCFRSSFINLILSFLPPTSLMWGFSCVSLSHGLEFLQSQSVSDQLHWLPHSPPSNHLQQPYWLKPYYWDTFTTHTLPYIHSILGLQAFFWILKL
jgi:hypothetical protein